MNTNTTCHISAAQDASLSTKLKSDSSPTYNENNDIWPDDTPTIQDTKHNVNDRGNTRTTVATLRNIESLLHDSNKDDSAELAPLFWNQSGNFSESQATLIHNEYSNQTLLTKNAPSRERSNETILCDRSYFATPYQVYYQPQIYSHPYYHHDPRYNHYYQQNSYPKPYWQYSHPHQSQSRVTAVEMKEEKPHSPQVEATKNKRQKKDPKAPKHPMSGFLFFLASTRKHYYQMYPNYNVGKISKVVAEKWKGMSDGEKAPFLRQSEQDKNRYSKEIQLWHQKSFSLKPVDIE
jgi:hypothetical protein